MRVGDDAIIAEVALGRGWIDQERLRRAIELQWAAAAAEVDVRLLDVLAAKGFLAAEQAGELDAVVTLRELAEPERARSIPGYVIVKSLGQDGLGGLFRAIQLSMDRPVCLKVLAPELAREARFAERFQREAKAVGRISHPNVVGGLDVGRAGEFQYYSMELVEGQDLRQVLRGGPMAADRVAEIGEQMVRALVHAAELGLVHRDIQPRQIVVTLDGVARLCGLGQTRFPGDPSVGDTGIPVGSPRYLSPELAAGSRAADIRSDVYSLGATLYHLATGQAPFKAPTLAGLLRKHVEESPPRAAGVRSEVPEALSALLARMMAKSPSERCSSLGSLLDAMQAVRARPARAARVAAPPLPTIATPAPPILVEGEAQAPARAPEAAVALPEAVPAPPAAGGRFHSGVLWSAALAALSAGLVVAVVWALRARAIWPRPTPAPAAVEEPSPAPAPPAPSPPPPSPSPPKAAAEARPKRAEPPQDELARRLREEAFALDREPGKPDRRTLLALRRAALAAGEGAGGDVRERLQVRSQRLEKTAQEELDALEKKLKTWKAHNQFGDALNLCREFRQDLLFGYWGERVYAHGINLQADAEARYLDLATLGARRLQEGKLAKGIDSYRGVGELGIPWMSRAGKGLCEAAEAWREDEEKRRDGADKVRERRQALGKLSPYFAEIQDEMKRRQYGRAAKAIEKIPGPLRAGEPGAAVVQLGARLRTLEALWDALTAWARVASRKYRTDKEIKVSLYGNTGVIKELTEDSQTIVLDRGGEAGTLNLVLRGPNAVQAPKIVELAGWALEKEPAPARALKIGLFYLAEGRSQEAGQQLREAGPDGAPYVPDLLAEEAIAKGLAPQKGQRSAAARERLTEALDTYGATFPVLARHEELTRALAQGGGPVASASLAQLPLPETLRTLELLPRCRLVSGRPGNSAAAYLADPSERPGPALLGRPDWRDLTLTLRWRAESEQGSRLAMLFRVTELPLDQFRCYYVAVDGTHLTLGWCKGDRNQKLDEGDYPKLAGAGEHELAVAVSKSSLSVSVDGNARPEVLIADDSLSQGRVGLTTLDAHLAVEGLSVFLPPPWPAAEAEPPRP